MDAEAAAGAREILLVEDNPDDALLTRIEFEDAGLTNHLVVVEDGEDALNYLRRSGPYTGVATPRLVLLDLHLPRVDGREVLEEVEQDPTLQQIPIIVVSAPTELDWVEERFSEVITGVLPKPIGAPALIELTSARLGPDILRATDPV